LVNLRINIIFEDEKSKTSALTKAPISMGNLHRLKSETLKAELNDFFYDSSKREQLSIVLERYSHSVLDLSLNEISIHSAKHTEVEVDSPYERLESKFIKQTRLIYDNIDPTVQGRDIFLEFFKHDAFFVAKIFANRTYATFHSYVTGLQINILDRQAKPANPISSYMIRVNSINPHLTREASNVITHLSRFHFRLRR
jgi:hypothetical protein